MFASHFGLAAFQRRSEGLQFALCLPVSGSGFLRHPRLDFIAVSSGRNWLSRKILRPAEEEKRSCNIRDLRDTQPENLGAADFRFSGRDSDFSVPVSAGQRAR